MTTLFFTPLWWSVGVVGLYYAFRFKGYELLILSILYDVLLAPSEGVFPLQATLLISIVLIIGYIIRSRVFYAL